MNELIVPYDPTALAEKTERWRRLMRSRITSLVITIVIMTVIYIWQRDQLQGAGFIAVYGIVLGIAVAILIVTAVGYRRFRRELDAVAEGIAIRVGAPGIAVAGLAAPWIQVAKVTTVKGGFGRGPVLRLELTDGRQGNLPLDHVSVFPATVDSTVRAFSGGRHGVDLAALES